MLLISKLCNKKTNVLIEKRSCMEINVKISGGFANISQEFHTDTKKISDEKANEIILLAKKIAFSETKQNRNRKLTDSLEYEITIYGEDVKKITFDDQTITQTVDTLINKIREVSQ